MKIKISPLIISLIAAVLIQSINYAQAKPARRVDKNLVGNWQTEKIKLSPTVLKIDFGNNGSFDYELTQTWEGHYKQFGTKLVSTYSIPYLNKTTKDTALILIMADTLIMQESVKGKTEDFKFIRERSGHVTESGIAGKWQTDNYRGHDAELDYSKAGTFTMKEILREIKGNYIIEGKYFTVFSNREEMMHMRYQVFPQHDMLMIYNNKGNWMRLYRHKK